VAADGKNPCIPHQIGTDILMDWNWMVSVKKAREQNIESVVEFFDELDDDDEYKNGEKGDPLGRKVMIRDAGSIIRTRTIWLS